MDEKPRERYICTGCGSNNVVVNAYASWDEHENKFVLDALSDDFDSYCVECGSNRRCIFLSSDIHDILMEEEPDIEELLEYIKGFSVKDEEDKFVIKLITKIIYRIAENNNINVKDKVEAALVFMSL